MQHDSLNHQKILFHNYSQKIKSINVMKLFFGTLAPSAALTKSKVKPGLPVIKVKSRDFGGQRLLGSIKGFRTGRFSGEG